MSWGIHLIDYFGVLSGLEQKMYSMYFNVFGILIWSNCWRHTCMHESSTEKKHQAPDVQVIEWQAFWNGMSQKWYPTRSMTARSFRMTEQIPIRLQDWWIHFNCYTRADSSYICDGHGELTDAIAYRYLSAWIAYIMPMDPWKSRHN